MSDFEDCVPPVASARHRIEQTVACTDCSDVPKVADAGEVQTSSDGTRTQVMHNGVRVLAGGYHGDWMQEIIQRTRGHHEPQEERLFHEVVKRVGTAPTMIELGGFWLYYTLWFLHENPHGRAIAVEPDPAHIAIGKTNAALNGREVEIVNAFVGGDPGGPVPFATESSGTIDLPRVAVPQLLAERGLDRVDILHCDAQGAEVPVLESCADLLKAGRIKWLVVSTHAEMITGDYLTHQRCLATLRACGATVLAEHDVHEAFSGDGLIVACTGGRPADWPDVPLSRNRYSESLFRNPIYDLEIAKRKIVAMERELSQARRELQDRPIKRRSPLQVLATVFRRP